MPLTPQDYRKTAQTHRIGLAAARPAVGDVLIGTLYFSTDTFKIERSNGTTWVLYAGDGNLSSNVPLKNGTNAFTGANSFATNVLDLLVGQLKFPATQNASSNANTLDDYEEGTWTPAITFATPGDLNVVYSEQAGVYTKVGLSVILTYGVQTSTFTHTTAAGALRISGLPFTIPAGIGFFGSTTFNNITKAGYTQISPRGIASTSLVDFNASGSGVAGASIVAADCPTGGVLVLRGTLIHRATS